VDRLSAEGWAELVLEALRSLDRTNSPRSFESIGGLCLSRHLLVVAAEKRRSGGLAEAQATVDRSLAFGRLLVERDAEQPAAHLVLSEAYYHQSKIAWRVPDRVAVERNLRLALESAQRALVLDPNDAEARFVAGEKQRRLVRLMHPEPDTGGPPSG
jgi:hypothetical protein